MNNSQLYKLNKDELIYLISIIREQTIKEAETKYLKDNTVLYLNVICHKIRNNYRKFVHFVILILSLFIIVISLYSSNSIITLIFVSSIIFITNAIEAFHYN